MRVRVIGVVSSLVLAVVLGTPAGAAEPEVVLATDALEFAPAATDTHLSWNEFRNDRITVFAKAFAGGARIRVSPRGVDGYNGSLDGTTVTYQQYSQSRGVSDIYDFDVVAEQRTKIGRPVSTRRWEYDPSRSGDIVVFARWFPSSERHVILYDESTDTARSITSTTGRQWDLWVGQANGNWVTFEKENNTRRRESCDVFLYDITEETTTRIPNPNGRCQYASAVDDAGTVFYARSGFGCGLNVDVRAYPIGGPATTLVEIRDVHDLASMFAVDNGDTTTDLYYERLGCGRSLADIYKVTWAP